MVYIIPPFDEKIDADGKKIPNYDIIQNKYFKKYNERDDDRNTVRFELLNIFDLPLFVILTNIANTIMIIINDLTLVKTYSSVNSFVRVFIKDNRLLYLGILLIIFTLFLSFFFY